METETLIVGAGPAGLAVGACLRRAGRGFVMVERAPALAASWRRHYQRLHLHTAKRHSGLPFLPMPAHYPTYVPRAQVVEYLEAYAREFRLEPCVGEEVERATPTEAGWQVQTSRATRRARNLVIATGFNRVPFRPRLPGEERFAGELTHSGDYRSGAPYRQRRVLVVGLGNTGGEIAIDLVEQGAAKVELSVRGPVHVVKRDLLGMPTQELTIMNAWLPTKVLDATFGMLARMVVGDLSKWGIQRPQLGIASTVAQQRRIPLIDVGTIDLIRAGKINVRPDVRELGPDGVTFVDGTTGDYDALLLATGYRPGVEAFLEGAERVLDPQGYPLVHGRESALPGLYFVGFHSPITGMLREIGIEARRVAATIAAQAL
jgi:indole-3-pyruvate monooxygenase